jgi:SAM-dependent methyltransferase
MKQDFTKEFFQRTWGEGGYYENFSYGVGISNVYQKCITPFWNDDHHLLEIGSGGGSFTEGIVGYFFHVTAVDVIAMPENFNRFKRFSYFELPDQSYDLPGVPDDTFDICFAYNVFCHLSNDALIEYLQAVHRVLKTGGNFIFMLSDFRQASKHIENPEKYELGDLLPMGHFYQDGRTLDIIADKTQWEIVSRNLIPEHRDIIIHLKKK